MLLHYKETLTTGISTKPVLPEASVTLKANGTAFTRPLSRSQILPVSGVCKRHPKRHFCTFLHERFAYITRRDNSAQKLILIFKLI